MARTKQTARKSSGGKAPRKQCNASSSSSMRQYFVSQQAVGVPAPGVGAKVSPKIFVNCGNTFGEFQFKRKRTPNFFEPNVSVGRIAAPSDALPLIGSDLYMRVDFCSNHDGDAANIKARRPPLDAVFVVDVSGSMGSSFRDDVDRRSKLQVAKDCIAHILTNFTPSDRAAVVAFNTSAYTVADISFTTSAFVGVVNRAAASLNPCGGTELARGLTAGFTLLRNSPLVNDDDETCRMQRVFFLTDMESSHSDESDVAKIATREADMTAWLERTVREAIPKMEESAAAVEEARQEAATASSTAGTPLRRSERKRKQVQVPESAKKTAKSPAQRKIDFEKIANPAHVTIVGIGIDLSIASIERISAIPGAKYMSVASAGELYSTVAEDFNFDAAPLAFNIQMQLPPGLSILQVFGSSELDSLPSHSTSALISAEFPVPLSADDLTNGGLYLFKLAEDAAAAATMGPKTLKFSWLNRDGSSSRCEVDLAVPPPLAVDQLRSEDCDTGLRKAVALSQYVSLLTTFIVGTDSTGAAAAAASSSTTPSKAASSLATMPLRIAFASASTSPSASTVNFLRCLDKDRLADAPVILPTDTPEQVAQHVKNITKFSTLLAYLTAEVEAGGDSSLSTNNQNIVQTITQVINAEKAELQQAVQQLRADTCEGYSTSSNTSTEAIPRGMMCPISLGIMRDPVMASDGHSYEREFIEKWLDTNAMSPVTQMPLSDRVLTPNYSLRAAIQTFLESKTTTSHAAAPPVVAPVVVSCIAPAATVAPLAVTASTGAPAVPAPAPAAVVAVAPCPPTSSSVPDTSESMAIDTYSPNDGGLLSNCIIS